MIGNVAKIHRGEVQFELARLHLRKVEKVVDEREQMTAA
jgi:hypothetical protein